MLRVSHLSCSRGNKPLFADVSFELKAGQALHLEGDNGVGKTSLLRIVCGLSPADAAKQGIEVVVGQFPFSANGRALSMDGGDNGGFVRVVARRHDHRVLGIQAVGKHVSELSSQFATALEMGALLEDIAGTIHVHPTLSEAFHESALKALGHAIHI